MSARGAGAATALALAVALVAAWSLVPALWQATTAVKPEAQLTSVPALWVPSPSMKSRRRPQLTIVKNKT